jgi:hypothetical protein
VLIALMAAAAGGAKLAHYVTRHDMAALDAKLQESAAPAEAK